MKDPDVRLDHLVLGARNLAEGVSYVRELLGVEVSPGGQHERYGTHNCLLRMQHSSNENLYFEIISIDPDVLPVVTPRWYSMDVEDVLSQLEDSPRLLAWVASTDDIATAASSQPAHQNARVVPLQRGALTWKMLLPDSGTAADPLLPWMIEWPAGVHPAGAMPEPGCSLKAIDVYHADIRSYDQQLKQLGVAGMVRTHHIDDTRVSPCMQVEISGQYGDIVLPGIVWSEAHRMVPVSAL